MKDRKKNAIIKKIFFEKIPEVEALFWTFGISIVEMLLWK